MVIPDTNRNNYWYLVISVQELPQICPMESHRTCFQYWPVLHCSQVPANCTNQAQYSAPPSHVDARTRAPRAHTHTHTRLTALCLGLSGSAGTRKVKPICILLKQKTVSDNGISWGICKSAPLSRQITMPAPHHSVFLQAGCPSCRPTNRFWSTEGNVDACLE